MEYVLINKGALKLALNVLHRAGKEEIADEVQKAVSEVSIYCKPEPVTQEALDAGMKFCCGKEEKLIQEIANLRNIVQAGMTAKCKKVFDSWNYYFPDDQREFKE